MKNGSKWVKVNAEHSKPPCVFSLEYVTMKLALLLLGAGFFWSCSLIIGNDGNNGSPHLAIDWIEDPEYYTDNNPSIPTGLTKNSFYPTQTGTFDFEYGYSDGFGWEGYYIIKQGEPGEKGKSFRKNGKDGKDNFYTLLLTYHGSEFDNYYEKRISQDERFFEVQSGGYILQVYMRPFTWNPSQHPPHNKLRED